MRPRRELGASARHRRAARWRDALLRRLRRRRRPQPGEALQGEGRGSARGLPQDRPDRRDAQHPPLDPSGAATVRQCQGAQLATLIADRHDVDTAALVTGDFNESPGTFIYDQLTSRGWRDGYLAAGNAECDRQTGAGCTSGRADEDLSALESPASNENERIDYIFVVPPAPGSLCAATLDPVSDPDGDGTTTRRFADAPNPFAPTCGPAPDPICWPSDHEGAELDLDCS